MDVTNETRAVSWIISICHFLDHIYNERVDKIMEENNFLANEMLCIIYMSAGLVISERFITILNESTTIYIRFSIYPIFILSGGYFYVVNICCLN